MFLIFLYKIINLLHYFQYVLYKIVIYENNYVSLPILYNYCNSFICDKLKIKNIFEEINIDYNYDLINKINKGYNLFDNKYNWNSKKEYYELYGHAEQTIILPKIDNSNSCAIYAHYDSNNEIKDYVIIGIERMI